LTVNHFTATGIVFNSKNQVLMVFHKKLNVWLPPGGHIEEDELPDDAVIREILEETGIRVKIKSLKQDIDISNKDSCRELERPFIILLEDIEGNGKHNHIDMIYICSALNDEFTPQKLEVSDIGWFTLDEINELETFDNVKQTIKKAYEYLSSS